MNHQAVDTVAEVDEYAGLRLGHHSDLVDADAVVAAVVGCLVVLRRMAFLGDALSHAMIDAFFAEEVAS